MPIILEWTYTDGTKEIDRIPVQVWRQNENKVIKTFIKDKVVASVKLDPFRETADINESNNSWNTMPEPSKLKIDDRLADQLDRALRTWLSRGSWLQSPQSCKSMAHSSSPDRSTSWAWQSRKSIRSRSICIDRLAKRTIFVLSSVKRRTSQMAVCPDDAKRKIGAVAARAFIRTGQRDDIFTSRRRLCYRDSARP